MASQHIRDIREDAVGESLFFNRQSAYREPTLADDSLPKPVMSGLLENTVQMMIDGMSDEVCLIGSDGTILAANRAWTEMTETLSFQGLGLGGDFIRFNTDAAADGHEFAHVLLKGLFELYRGERTRFRHVTKSTMDPVRPCAKIQMVDLPFHDEHYVLLRARDVTEEERLKRRRRAVTARLSHIRGHERRRMAQELRHCTAGPLDGLELGLSKLETAVGAESVTAMSDCNKAIQKVQRDVRALSFLWHPPSLDDHGLAEALEMLVAGCCHRLGISSEVVIDDIGPMPRTTAALLYCLAQNALDSLFHEEERPTSIKLRMAAPTEFLHLIIEYDAPLASRHALELAMKTIEEQLGEMNGQLSIHQVLGGTFIAASIPHARATG